MKIAGFFFKSSSKAERQHFKASLISSTEHGSDKLPHHGTEAKCVSRNRRGDGRAVGMTVISGHNTGGMT